MKSIRKWLEEDAGITLGITSLTSYISRIRPVWQQSEAQNLRLARLYNLKPHPDLVRPLRLGQQRAPNTIRSLKPNAFCRNRSSTSASSITMAIQKEEI